MKCVFQLSLFLWTLISIQNESFTLGYRYKDIIACLKIICFLAQHLLLYSPFFPWHLSYFSYKLFPWRWVLFIFMLIPHIAWFCFFMVCIRICTHFSKPCSNSIVNHSNLKKSLLHLNFIPFFIYSTLVNNYILPLYLAVFFPKWTWSVEKTINI